MNVPLPGVTVDPQGVSTSVAITDSHGNTPTVYSDRFGVNTVALPDAITTRTTFFLPGEGPWTITPTASGQVTKTTTLTLEDSQVATVTVGSVFDASQWEQFGAYAGVTAAVGNATTGGDAASLNAVISAAVTSGNGKVVGRYGSTFYLEAPIVTRSGCTLDMTGCTVIEVAGTNNQLLTNYSAQNPAGTASDAAISSGSNVVTTALAATVGQTVVIAGAGGNGNGPLVGNVSAVGSGTLTLTTLDGRPCNATATVSAASITSYTRDKNIKVLGGSWQRGSNGGTTSPQKMGLFFRHVDQLTVDIDEFTSSAGNYAISAGDVSNYRVGIGHVDTSAAGASGDGIHLLGPAANVEVTRLAGKTGDDSFSITCSDYNNISDVAGDVIGVRWGSINTSTQYSGVKLMAGVGRLLDGVTGGLLLGQPTNAGVFIGEDTGNVATTGGSYGKIDFGMVALTNTGAPPLNLSAPAADSIKGQIRLDSTSTASGAIALSGSSTVTLDKLHVDLDVNSAAGIVSLNKSNITINDFVLDGYFNQIGSTNAPIYVTNGTVGRLETRGDFTLSANTHALVQFGATTGTIGQHVHTGVCSGGYLAQTFSGGTAYSCTMSGRCYNGVHAFGLSGPKATITLAGGTFDTFTQRVFNVAAGVTVLVQGHCNSVNLTDPILLTKGSGTVARFNGATLNVAAQDLTPSLGDICYNGANATGVFPGKGVCVYDGTVWRLAAIGAVKSGTATLAAGTVTVSDTQTTASTEIRLENHSIGGTPGALYISAKTAGTSFTISSTSGTDTSVIRYEIVTY